MVTSVKDSDDELKRNLVTKTTIHVSRPLFTQKDLNEELHYKKTASLKWEGSKLNSSCIKLFLLRTFPIVTWLSSYKREYLMGDLISGATVCSMHITGMGHAMLAGLPPVVGVYMGFFPTLPYAVLTSSKHTSIGSNCDEFLECSILDL